MEQIDVYLFSLRNFGEIFLLSISTINIINLELETTEK